MGAILRKSEESDINIVADNLRKEDADEVVAQGYKDCREAVGESYKASAVRFTLEKEGKAIAMFGIAPIDDKSARIWMLGTPEVSTIKKTFCEYSIIVINHFLNMCPVLIAQVDGRYKKTHRWLKWLGATKSEPYKINHIEFNNYIFDRR